MKWDQEPLFYRLFVPRYNECALFLMSFSFLLLFLTDSRLLLGSLKIISENIVDLQICALLVAFVFGMAFSFYHVFVRRKKTIEEKRFMLFFAVTVNGVSGFLSGKEMLMDSWGFLILFPIWNMVNAVLLLILYLAEVIDEGDVEDDDASPLQVILGSVVVLAVLFVCQYWFNMTWPVVFSLCVVYSTTLNHFITAFLSRHG